MNYMVFILDLLILAGIPLKLDVIALASQFLSSCHVIWFNSNDLETHGDERP